MFPGGAELGADRAREGEAASTAMESRCSAATRARESRHYPEVGLQAARARANHLLDEARQGINPKISLGQSATAYSLTVRKLSERYLQDYVHSRSLDSAKNYETAFGDAHSIRESAISWRSC